MVDVLSASGATFCSAPPVRYRLYERPNPTMQIPTCRGNAFKIDPAAMKTEKSRLSDSLALNILRKWYAGDRTIDIAARFGVGLRLVRAVVQRHSQEVAQRAMESTGEPEYLRREDGAYDNEPEDLK